MCSVDARSAQTPPPQPAPVFRSGTELVLVDVVVRDQTGAIVRGLTPDDFSVTEDDKPQTITSFDFEELDSASTTADAGWRAGAGRRSCRSRRPRRHG